jgi:PIN domain nuclease of toxin-antitoxin system
MKYLLDTHTWIWWNMRPERLSAPVRSLISDTNAYEEMLLSAISTWEFCKLLEKGKLGIKGNPEAWLDLALRMAKLRLVPLSPRIVYRSTVLPPPFHSDPADQIIVATAREENATLLTTDRLIIGYDGVETFW